METFENDKLKFMVAEIAPSNYYNQEQNIIRIKIKVDDTTSKYFDMYLIQSVDFPNPNDHYALVATRPDVISGLKSAIMKDDIRLDLPPGYKDEATLDDQITFGFVWLINKRIMTSTTVPNDTSSGMHNQKATSPSDPKSLKYSISPSLPRDYTTTRGKKQDDYNTENIGIFITDNSVILKAGGGSIVLGPDGITLLGDKFESSTKGGKGMMQDNPFCGWFPSTIMTIPLGIEYIPNYNYILSIGSACQRLNKGMATIGKVTKNVTSFIGKT